MDIWISKIEFQLLGKLDTFDLLNEIYISTVVTIIITIITVILSLLYIFPSSFEMLGSWDGIYNSKNRFIFPFVCFFWDVTTVRD